VVGRWFRTNRGGKKEGGDERIQGELSRKNGQTFQTNRAGGSRKPKMTDRQKKKVSISRSAIETEQGRSSASAAVGHAGGGHKRDEASV